MCYVTDCFRLTPWNLFGSCSVFLFLLRLISHVIHIIIVILIFPSKNITNLLNQIYKTDILVVNNASTDGTDIKIKEDGYLENENLIYKKLPKNLGGAGGFTYGVKFALENNYDYVWLMDDNFKLPQMHTCHVPAV